MGIHRGGWARGGRRIALVGSVLALTGCSVENSHGGSDPSAVRAERRSSAEGTPRASSDSSGDRGFAALPEGRVTLEEQLARLASIGLVPNAGVTVDDFLRSFSREDYEAAPFDLVLFVFGIELEREPFGRFVSDVAWNLDTECVEGPGSYRAILENLCRIAGNPELVTEVVDEVDVTQDSGTIEYTIAGERRILSVQIHEDWADPEVVGQILADIEGELPGRRFYAKEDGQTSVWFALTPEQVEALREWGVELTTEK